MISPKKLLAGLSRTFFFSLTTALGLNYLSVQLPILPNLVAKAGIIDGYIPPQGFQRLQRTEGGGSRGCSEATNPVSLNLLVPSDHVATTVSGHPTFLWHISGSLQAPVRFTLVEQDISQRPILKTQVQVKSPGIVKLQLPPNTPDLAIGKQYRWTVSLVCNEKRPSSNILAQAVIERVAQTSTLKRDLAATTDERIHARIYAQSGIWYDAIATSYKASNTNEQKQLANAEYFFGLLEQVGLSNVAAQEQQRFKKS